MDSYREWFGEPQGRRFRVRRGKLERGWSVIIRLQKSFIMLYMQFYSRERRSV